MGIVSVVFWWVISIFLALFGLVLSFGSPIAGILILLSGVTLMPPMAAKLKNIPGRQLLFPALFLGSLVMFGLSVQEQEEARMAREAAKSAEETRQAKLQSKAEAEEKREKFAEQRDTILAKLRALSEAGDHHAVIEQGVVYESMDKDVANMVNNARNVLAEKAEAERQARVVAAREKRALEALQKKWHVSKGKSDLDDSQNVYMYVAAGNTIPGPWNKLVRPKLWIRCAENTTSFLIDWDVSIHIRNTSMLFRIDSQPAQTRTFPISTDHKTLGYFSGKKAIPFIKSLFGANELLLRVTPYGKEPAQVTFNLSGIEQAVKPLRKACGW